MIYRLKSPEDMHELVDLDVIDLAKLINDTDFKLIRRMFNSNESLQDRWVTPSCGVHPYFAANPAPDISFWGNFLALNKKAFDALAPIIKHDGEFLPIRVEGHSLQFFNCTQLATEIPEQSLINYEDGFPNGLKSLVFDESDILGKAIFKSKLEGCNALFVTDEFKSLCEQHTLTGLCFDKNLVNIFSVMEYS